MEIPRSDPKQSLINQFEHAAFQNDKQAMVGLMHLMIIITCMIGGSVMYFYDMNSYLSLFLLGFVCFFGWLLNRAGHSRSSAVILIAALLIVIQFNIFVGFGIHDVAIIAWPALIFFSGLLFSWRIIPYFTAVIMGLAIVTKLIPNTQFLFDYSDTGDLIVMLLILLAFSVITISLLRGNEHLIQTLRQSDERFHALIEHGRDNISLLAADGTLLWESPSVDNTLGYARNQFVGHNIFELMHPSDQAWTSDMYAQVVQVPGSIQEGAFRLLHADGTWRWIECSATNLLNEPNVQAIVLNYRDITKRKQAEETLHESEERYRTLFQEASDGTFYLSTDLQILAVNESFARMHGYSVEEMQGMRLQDLDTPESARLSPERIRRVMAGEVIEFESEHYHKNGHTFPLAVSTGLISVGGKQIIQAFHRDITERKHSEQALMSSEARFRAVVQTANDAIITMDTHGNIVFWNPAAETIFGYSTNEVIGAPVSQIVPEQFRELQRHGVARALSSNERKITGGTVEVTGLAKDGREFPIEMSLAEWKTQEGIFFTAVIRDVSERRYSEERILQSEKKYRELFQVNKDGIAVFLLNPNGPPGIFVELNNAAPKMLGYTRDEMLKLTPMMLEPYTTQEQLQFRQSEFELKGAANFETILLHKNGRPVFTEITAQLIHYEGKPAIMNIVRDITERKQHENELQAIAIVSEALRTASTRAEMLPVILEQLSRLLHCESMSVEIIDPINGDAVVEAAYGAWASLIGFRQPSGTGMNAVISKTRRPHHNNNIKGGSRIGIPAYSMDNIPASAGVPLIAQDQVIGFLWMGHSKNISENEVRLLVAVADIAANAIYRATLHEQTQKDATDLARAYDSTLEGWAHALELRDQETEGHTRRVVQMTLDLALAMGIRESELENVQRGALLHDIGKMGIPDSILLKPGTLNEREWEVMRQHPAHAYRLLGPIEYLHPAVDIPYCHHEKWDGTGYPRGLKGEEIPLAARIFAIVDVWDALTSDRPYRLAWSKDKALAHISEQSGRHFEPAVVEAFLKII
ncbi:MAG: PAS domain S-box protein [Chloroflexi bacterium]|nr:PAS domain S-box protein [Chloroflexota bacterium]